MNGKDESEDDDLREIPSKKIKLDLDSSHIEYQVGYCCCLSIFDHQSIAISTATFVTSRSRLAAITNWS